MADLDCSEPSLPWMGRGAKPSWRGALIAAARLIHRRNLLTARNFVAAAIAAALVLLVGAVAATLWTSVGDTNISPAGWIAMGFGVIFTLALGIGLMALVFISSRRGYDERGRGSNAAQQRNSSQ
jgi:dipeptide/tripeptide permease